NQEQIDRLTELAQLKKVKKQLTDLEAEINQKRLSIELHEKAQKLKGYKAEQEKALKDKETVQQQLELDRQALAKTLSALEENKKERAAADKDYLLLPEKREAINELKKEELTIKAIEAKKSQVTAFEEENQCHQLKIEKQTAQLTEYKNQLEENKRQLME